MLKTLLRHDGSDVSLTENGGFNIDVSQLNDLANSGTRFAQAHSWDEIPMERGLRPSIIALPIGFRSYELLFYVRFNSGRSPCLGQEEKLGSLLIRVADIGRGV